MSLAQSLQREADASGRAFRRFALGVPRGLWVLLAIAVTLVAEYEMARALEPPGQTIRQELAAAAGELQSQLFPQATPAMRAAIRGHFGDRDVDIDVSRWPNVAATLHRVDWEACVSAVREARRIEDPAVIDLEAYLAPTDCRERNEMRWWIRP